MWPTTYTGSSDQFQSRNRGSFDFKTLTQNWLSQHRQAFQSRNRGSFDFKPLTNIWRTGRSSEFQSRNRGSFDFKSSRSPRSQFKYNVSISYSRFFWFQGLAVPIPQEETVQFQSRNRGSFDFKQHQRLHRQRRTTFQSRNRGSFDFKDECWRSTACRVSPGFNLVIEVLLISSSSMKLKTWTELKFQSRNRGSFDFKLINSDDLIRNEK